MVDQKVLIAGDYDGNIHLFDIGDGVKSKTLPDNSKEVLDPFRVGCTWSMNKTKAVYFFFRFFHMRCQPNRFETLLAQWIRVQLLL